MRALGVRIFAGICGLLAVVTELHAQDIFLLDLVKTDSAYRVENSRNITSRPGYDNQPFFTADGKDDSLHVPTRAAHGYLRVRFAVPGDDACDGTRRTFRSTPRWRTTTTTPTSPWFERIRFPDQTVLACGSADWRVELGAELARAHWITTASIAEAKRYCGSDTRSPSILPGQARSAMTFRYRPRPRRQRLSWYREPIDSASCTDK